ncbi:MAG: MarR family transcriptional regulator [Acidobacteriota bacterium]|nr:MarR family transcriptional regulator [Acidobacteriota bacterium]
MKLTEPFYNQKEEVSVSILLSAERLKSTVIETLKSVRLTPPQYNVLRVLRGAGGAGASVREIGKSMINKDSDITRLLDRLESRKLILRERQAHDRRVVKAYITDAGLAILADLDKPVGECHERQLGHLNEKELSDLSRLLEIVRKSGT